MSLYQAHSTSVPDTVPSAFSVFSHVNLITTLGNRLDLGCLAGSVHRASMSERMNKKIETGLIFVTIGQMRKLCTQHYVTCLPSELQFKPRSVTTKALFFLPHAASPPPQRYTKIGICKTLNLEEDPTTYLPIIFFFH